MVQDYRYLNEQAIKNNYPLPLILDIVENISAKKVFMKLDLRQGHNDIWPKKKDEWKAFFMIPERLFEPTVIFFRLTNSLVTFQTIINKILQDLINTGKVASFIENVIVGTEVSRSLTMNLTFIFIFISYFIFLFFSFSIFRTTRVRGYQSCCHISHNLMA